MKKRIGSLLLILALCFTLLPTAAFAAENTQEPTEPQEPQETQDAKLGVTKQTQVGTSMRRSLSTISPPLNSWQVWRS